VADATVRALGRRIFVLYMFLVVRLCVATVFSVCLGSYPQNLNKRKKHDGSVIFRSEKGGKTAKNQKLFRRWCHLPVI